MGEAIAKRLVSAGATVITTARTVPGDMQSSVLFIQADVSKPDGIETVVNGVRERLGGIDILVNNVGGSSAPVGGALAMNDDDWEQVFNANWFSAVRLDRAFLPAMIENSHYSHDIHSSALPGNGNSGLLSCKGCFSKL